MRFEFLIPGMKFASKHKLSQREIKIIALFLQKPYTTLALAKELGTNIKTVHNQLNNLRLKNLLVLKNRDSTGTNLYEFNMSILEE